MSTPSPTITREKLEQLLANYTKGHAGLVKQIEELKATILRLEGDKIATSGAVQVLTSILSSTPAEPAPEIDDGPLPPTEIEAA